MKTELKVSRKVSPYMVKVLNSSTYYGERIDYSVALRDNAVFQFDTPMTGNYLYNLHQKAKQLCSVDSMITESINAAKKGGKS